MIALIRRILAVSGKYKARIQAAFVFSFLKAMCSKAPLGLAFLMLWAFLENRVTPTLCLLVGVGVVAFLLLEALLQHVSDRLQAAAGYMVFEQKRMDLGRHLMKLPMGYFTEGNIGKISSVLSTDMVFIEENCMHDIGDMAGYVFAQAIMTVFLFSLSPWLGLLSVVVLLCFLILGKGLKKASLEESALRQEQSENLTEAVLDFAEGIGITKTYNLLGKKSKELTDNFRKSREANIHFEERFTPWGRGVNLIYAVGSTAVTALALGLFFANGLTPAFCIGVLLFVFDLFAPMKALYNQATRLTVMNSCMDRIEGVFDEKELPDQGKKAIPETANTPEVEFQHVSFAYGEKEVLHDVSFTIPRNTMLALVGPSGGGKTTVANLLSRFWDVKSGKVLVRGVDIREAPLSDLMDHISMVFQRVYLFQDTIFNNISMGRPDATKEEVIAAAKKARCHEFITALPDGYDTVVGEGGASLSGGEQQRISIARCILKDAPIVILDEATANVDADNESYIQQAISELCRGKTLLVIAHRLNTIRGADKIIVIADGRVAQEGTHQELMAQKGIYKDFVTVRENSMGWNRRAEA